MRSPLPHSRRALSALLRGLPLITAVLCGLLAAWPLTAQVLGGKNIVINAPNIGSYSLVDLYNYGPDQVMTNWVLAASTNFTGSLATTATFPFPAGYVLPRHGTVSVYFGLTCSPGPGYFCTDAANYLSFRDNGAIALRSGASSQFGVDYVRYGTPASPILPTNLFFNGAIAAGYLSSLTRVSDVNTRSAADWSTAGVNNRTGVRRHARVLINEVYYSSNASWVELYNPNPFSIDMTGLTLESYDVTYDGTAASRCDSLALTGITIPAGGFYIRPVTTCAWITTGEGQVALYHRYRTGTVLNPTYYYDGVDYVGFNSPVVSALPTDLIWTGGSAAVADNQSLYRTSTMDSDNIRDWMTGGATQNALNPGQQGLLPQYWEFGDEEIPISKPAGGWGNVITVNNYFILKEAKFRIRADANVSLRFVARYQLDATTWSAPFIDMPLTPATAVLGEAGVYSTGPASFGIWPGATYYFGIYASGNFTLYASNRAEPFPYGTFIGVNGENGYPAAPGTSPLNGTDGRYAFSQYWLTYQGPFITPVSGLPNGEVGTAYTQSFSSATGASPLSWSEAGALPPGVSFNASTQVLSGTPTGAGSYSISISATDANGVNDTKNYSFTIFPQLTVTTASLPDGTVGTAYSQQINASGGSGGNNWTVVSGLPAGLTLSTGGLLSGTPTTGGAVSLTVRVTDSLGVFSQKLFNFTILSPFAITTTSLPNGAPYAAYSQTLATSGGVGAVTWSVIAGVLPQNVSLNSATGIISGTPPYAGIYSFTVQAVDQYPRTATQALSINVFQALAITNTSLPIGVISAPYFTTALRAAGGTAPYTFSIVSGSLPPGLSLTAGGQLSGTPATLGAYPVTFQVTDNVATTAQRAYTITIAVPPQYPQWNARALFGGPVYDIQISPDHANDGTLFATGEGGDAFTSNDFGVSWSRLLPAPALANAPLSALRLSPVYTAAGSPAAVEAKTLFVCGLTSGVRKSTDRGATFGAANAGLTGNGSGGVDCEGLALSPNYLADHTVWALVAKYSATNSLEFFRSLDGGVSWTRLGGTIFGATLIAISPAFAADQTMYVSVGANLYKSTDGGITLPLRYSLANPIRQLVVSPNYAADRTLLLSLSNSYQLYRSTDGLASLSSLTTLYPITLNALASPGQPPRWFATIGVNPVPTYVTLISDNYGDTFTTLYSSDMTDRTAANTVAFSMAAASAGGQSYLYHGSDNGMFGSYDTGFSYNPRMEGMAADVGYGVYGRRNPARSSAGTSDDLVAGGESGWFRSGNGGLSWTRLGVQPGNTSPFLGLMQSPDYANDHVLILKDGGTLYRSNDGGQSFSAVLTGISAALDLFAFVPGFSGATGTLFVGTYGNGVYRSTDGGQTFAKFMLPAGPCSGANSATLDGLAVSPNYAADQTLFLSYASGLSGMACKSVNGGVSWTEIDNVGPGFPWVHGAIYPANNFNNGGPSRLVLVVSPNGVYRSTDGGASWAQLASFAAPYFSGQVFYSPKFAIDNTVFVTIGDVNHPGGAWRSSDGGVTFAPLGAGDQLLTRQVNGLYLASDFDGAASVNSVAVATTRGGGFFRSTDGGRSFQPVTDHKFIDSAINGIARAPGGVQGIVAGATDPGSVYAATATQGVFQSNDNGVTFTQLSKGLPQNANALAITVPSLAVTAPLTAVKNSAGVPQGLWKYNGTTWTQQTGANLSATGTYTSFLEDGTNLYAARADGVSVRSNDGGATWTALEAVQTDLAKLDYNAQATPTFLSEPAAKLQGPRPNSANAVTASLWAVSQSAGPRYSLDSGTTWIATPGTNDYALPGGQTWSIVRALGVNATSGSREVIAGSATGLFRSADGGATWRNVSGTGSGLEATSKNFSSAISTVTSAGNTDLLVGATGAVNGGVYLSGDGGEHWTQVNAGFDPANLSISSLIKTSCAGCPVQYYSGSYGGGMYTRTITVVAPPTFPAMLYSCYGSTSCSCATGGGSGPQQGGQAFKLCGSNFQAGAVIEFDGVPVYTNYAGGGCSLSATQIVCNAGASGTPAHAPGLASIRVRNPDTRIGFVPAQYTYTGGSPRAIDLRVAKASGSANLSWSCPAASCTTNTPARVYRSQNALFSLFLENYNGGASTAGGTGAFTNLGALATAQSYFWSVE